MPESIFWGVSARIKNKEAEIWSHGCMLTPERGSKLLEEAVLLIKDGVNKDSSNPGIKFKNSDVTIISMWKL